MDEVERSLIYFAHKAEAIATTFVMAINGAFFTIRAAGVTPSPSQIEQAKLNVSKARYVYVDGINELISELTDQALANNSAFNPLTLEFATRHLISISTEMTLQANKAISSGHQNKAAALLGSNVRGAMGKLLQQKLTHVELSVRDMTGHKWSEPSMVIKTAVTNLAHQILKGGQGV